MTSRSPVNVRRRFAHAALAAAMAVAGCAATGLPSEPVVKHYELHQWVAPMKSGLRVVVQEDPSSDLVVATSVFGVGGTSDPAGKEGLAHVVEHLAFKSKPGGVQFWDQLKRLGASFNATTWYDFTTYYVIAHKDNLEMMLQLEAWRLARTLEGVTAEEFAIEREVVRNELRLRVENALPNRMSDLVMASLFPTGHPLARSVIGSHDSLSAMTLEDARAFVKKHYTPDNCTIVISGAVTTAEVKRLIGKWPAEILFAPGGGPQGPEVPPRQPLGQRPAPTVPPPPITSLPPQKGPVAQPQLVIAWSLPGAYRRNGALLDMVAIRLNTALSLGLDLDMYDDDDVESVGAFTRPQADGSVMFIVATLKPGADPDKARGRILDAVASSWTTESGRLETEAVRWATATNFLVTLSDPVDKATSLAEYLAATGKTAFFKETFDELADVKSSDVTDLAFKWLRRERAVTAYFEPETDQIAKGVSGATGVSSGAGQGRREQHDLGRGVGGAGADYSPEAIRKVARPPGLASLPRFKLPNGVDVVVLARGSAPVAEIQIAFPGGNAHARPYGLGSLASGFSRSTCRDHGDLTPVGGSGFGGTGALSTTENVQVLSGNLPNGLAVLSDEIACRDVMEEVFLHLPRIVERRVKVYERQLKRPEVQANKLFWAELYPNHPFGERMADPAPLKSVKREDAQAFVRSAFRPDKAVMVVAGDVVPAEVKRLAEQYFQRWTAGGGSAFGALPPPPAPQARKVMLIDRPGATQASVDIGCRLHDATPELLPVFDILEALADEKSWELREQWGATYGVAASIGKQPGGTAHLVLSGAVENGKVGAATARLLALVGDLSSAAVDEKLFLLKRWDVARQFATRFATPSASANAVISASLSGWPVDVWDQYPEHLAAASLVTLKTVAAGCARKEIVVIAGDAKKVRPELEAAGIKLSE